MEEVQLAGRRLGKGREAGSLLVSWTQRRDGKVVV